MIWCVIPAAGRGARFSAAMPKQYAPLVGVPMLVRTLDRLLSHPRVAGAMVALSANDELWPSINELEGKPVRTCLGGAERADSVLAALDELSTRCADDDWVMVHDAARPCVRSLDLDRMITTLGDDAVGGILAVPVRDTLKRCDESGAIIATVDRTQLWHALTPQMFRLGTLTRAIEAALAGGMMVTDEAQAIEHAGHTPRVVAGHADNLKITHPEDLELARLILAAQDGAVAGGKPQ